MRVFGLIGLIITVAIIAIWATRIYMTNSTNTVDGEPTTNAEAIRQAEDIANTINDRNDAIENEF